MLSFTKKKWAGRLIFLTALTPVFPVFLATAFYQPVLEKAVIWFLTRATADYHLKPEFHVEKLNFSEIVIKDFRTVPTGPTPYNKINIESIRLKFHPWDLIRRKFQTAFEEVHLGNVHIVLSPANRNVAGEKTTNNAASSGFRLPNLIFPKIIDVQNLNVSWGATNAPRVLLGMNLTLDPSRAGVLSIQRFSWGPNRVWKDLSGNTSFKNRQLILSNFRVDSQLQIDRFNLDFSKWEKNQFSSTVAATLFGGSLSTDASLQAIDEKPWITVKGHVADLDLGRMREDLGLKNLLLGRITMMNIQLSGNPREKGTWKGNLETNLADVQKPSANGEPENEKVDGFLSARIHDSQFDIQHLEIRTRSHPLLAGTMVLPLDAKQDGDIHCNLLSRDLDLEILFGIIGRSPPIRGVLNARILAEGKLSSVEANAALMISDLRSTQYEEIKPAQIHLDLVLHQHWLTIQGEVDQPQVKPATLNAELPLNLLSTLRNGLDPATPVKAALEWPQTSLDFLTSKIKSISELKGWLEAHITIGGTFGSPVIDGVVNARVDRLALTSNSIPELDQFGAKFNLHNRKLAISECHGNIAGGPFDLTGTLVFETLAKPLLDLHLSGRNVLLRRNDLMLVRSDLDLKVEGTVLESKVTGQIGITKSRYFQNIEILPIGFTGRPAPSLQRAPMNFSIDVWPLQQWTFDVLIATKDPFLIRSNLAYGDINLQLQLTGTGLQPELTGYAEMHGLLISLPFSQLKIDWGYLYFTPETGLNPFIDITGQSEIRNHLVQAYLYGSVQDPKVLFISDPPLPEEDIMTLLATGTTREELTSGANVIAGKATWLFLKQVYQKIFGPTRPTPENNDDFLSRFQFEAGTVDPETGRQQLTSTFKVTDNWFLIGDLGVEGDFRGRLKYLIRFR